MSRSNSRNQPKRRPGRVWVALAIMSAGSVFVNIPSCEGILTTFNPCGTVFGFCEPYEMQALFGDIPDWTLDPTCAVPYYGIYSGDTGSGCAGYEFYPTTPGPRPQGEQP